MRNENSVILAGPIEDVRSRVFGSYGFLNLKVAGTRVTVIMNQDEFDLAQTAEAAQFATLWGAHFDARQDKKDPAKYWYNISAKAKAITFAQEAVTPINHALVVGKVTGVEELWAAVACSYHIPKDKRWSSRTVRVLFDRPLGATENQEIMVMGTVEQYFGEVEHQHLKAATVQML